jgi:hypothetical protein
MSEQEINKLLQDAFLNEAFGTDVLNYAKLLVVRSCPQEQTPQLQDMIRQNDIKTFVEFAHTIIPDFDQKVVEYLRSYGYLPE